MVYSVWVNSAKLNQVESNLCQADPTWKKGFFLMGMSMGHRPQSQVQAWMQSMMPQMQAQLFGAAPSPTGPMAYDNVSFGMSMGLVGAAPPAQDNMFSGWGPARLQSAVFAGAESQRDKEREFGWNDAPEIDRKKVGEEDPKFLEPNQRLTAVARLQRFDGGFALSDKLLQLLQTSIQDVETVKSQFFDLGIDTDVVATMLASMWLGKYGREEADDMIRKAEEWIGQKGGLAISELSVKVASLVSFL